MRRILILLVLLMVVVNLLGCAGRPIEPFVDTTQYTQGRDVALGPFAYSVAKAGNVQKNQIENTGAFPIHLEKNIADLVREVTAIELSKTGLRLDSQADTLIYGDVTRFKINEGFSTDWSYDITYSIARKSTSSKLLSRQYTLSTTTSLPRSKEALAMCLRNVIAQGYSMFITDPYVRAILDASPDH